MTMLPDRLEPAKDGGREEFRSLTGLRGVFALWVVVMHTSIGMEVRHFSPDEQFDSAIANLIFSGVVAVDGFFLLSGFVLSYVYARHFRWNDLSFTPSFLLLRLARIYPVHIFLLAAYALVWVANIDWPAYECGNPHNRDASTCDRFGATRLLQSVLLINAWGINPEIGWNLPAWSISSEFFVYLAFPLLVIVARLCAPVTAAIAAVAVLVAMTLALPLYVPMFRGLGDDYGLLRVVPEFAAGLLLYRLWRASSSPSMPWGLIADASALIALGVLALNAMPWIAVFCLAVLILALAKSERGVTGRLLSADPVHWLGRISYSLYMVNVFVLEYIALNQRWFIKGNPLKYAWQGYATILVACVTSVLVAFFLYRYIEEPARLWAKRRLLTPRLSGAGRETP